MNALITWALARLDEPSTWRGIIGLLTGFGVALNPHQAAMLLAGGMGLAGFIGVVTKDPKNVPADVQAALTNIVIPVADVTINTQEADREATQTQNAVVAVAAVVAADANAASLHIAEQSDPDNRDNA
jgi:hypothetical protein